ncbi:metal-dependent hydrolase [Methanoregula sp.]|uniref:metal-dependent hydrolase n=1 Tax=Methanoregula sp. TaxID=2052170 RepID=UPI00356AF765
MFVVAHAFLGFLLGLVFLEITGDRRAVPVCVAGALLPDLLDKPLALLVPALGSGRTIGHCLLFILILSFIALLLYKRRHTLLGAAFVAGVFLHQIFDSMWVTMQTWLFPVFGPFPIMTVKSYTGYYLWLELLSPSEWLFFFACLVILAGMLAGKPLRPRYYQITAAILGLMGIFLFDSAWSGQGGSFFAPSYPAIASALTGILAIMGTVFFIAIARNNIRIT